MGQTHLEAHQMFTLNVSTDAYPGDGGLAIWRHRRLEVGCQCRDVGGIVITTILSYKQPGSDSVAML